MCNLHRVGSLVLLVHDCADIFLEVSNRYLNEGIISQYQHFAGRQDYEICTVPKGLRYHLRCLHGGVDRHAIDALPADYL